MKSLRPFIIIALAIGALYIYVWPQWQTIGTLRTRHVELQSALVKGQELATLRDQLLAQYNAIPQADMDKISRVVPNKYDPVKLVTDINAVASKYGMFIKGVKITDTALESTSGAIQAAPEVEIYNKKELSFATEGQYKNFVAFISDLEKSLQLLDIQKVEIVSRQNATKGAPAGLEFKVSVTTYWMN